jgi:hypothetical protein
MSYRDVELTYHIPEGTAVGRVNGAQKRHDTYAHKGRLTKSQEEGLAEWILGMDAKD